MFTSIRAPKAGSNYQADLMFWKRTPPYKAKIVDGRKTQGVLNVVDVYSRRAWSIPFADKGKETIAAAFRVVLQ